MKTRFPIRMNRADEIRRQASRRFLLSKSLGLICAICFASIAFAQNRYQITRIPAAQGANSVALGINNKGEVVGYSFHGEDYQAFLYSSSDHSLTDVGSLGGKINAACAINDAGQVIGYSQDENGNLQAFVYSRKQPIASLGTLEGASTSEALGINNRGAAVGDSQSGNQNHRPVLFSDGSIQDLGLGRSNESDALETAYAVNDAGQIVGRHSAGDHAFHAFLFVNGNTTDFSTLGGTNGEAFAINKNGVVVGDSDTADGPAHAFVFDHSQLKDLGTLPGFENASYARGINNPGDIVGESDSGDQKRAFLYAKSQLAELDKLAGNLSEAGFNSLDVAYGINDKGWIVGYGTTTDNLTAAFIAVPEGRGNRSPASGLRQPQGQAQAVSPQLQRQDRDQEQQVPESDEEGYDVFYTGLSSDEGSWVEAGNYGYCFRPRVAENWRPYQDGHWVWTDRGWYWDSNERFGWATYHYGRWIDIGGTGWCWIPGNQWAPAWVSWRESDEHVGWAPLPPEADVSEHQPVSSWSDSYYGIGPAAYAFISYSHWREPNYAPYIERPERNVQIINETKNVTNIVTNDNVINNFGPPVQTIATRTNQNIPQVKLAFNPATNPKANYGQTRQGTQLNVVAPPATLKPEATHAPSVQNRLENPQVQKGWQGVKAQDAEKLKKTIAEQNPLPKDLPKPTPLVYPQIVNRGQVTGSPGATGAPVTIGSPLTVPGQKAPPNLVKRGPGSPKANVTPGASPSTPAAGKKPVPPNLLGGKPSGTPGVSPMVKPSGTPGGLPTGPGGKPMPKPTGNRPPGQNSAQASATPHPAAGPTQEKKTETAPQPTPPGGPANLMTPNPTPVSTPHSEPAAAPKSTSQLNATPPPKQETNTAPQVQQTPVPQIPVEHTSPVQPPGPKTEPPKQEIKTPAPQVQRTPAPQPRVVHTAPAQPPAQKAPAPKQEIKTPAPQVQRAPAPQPRVVHTAPAQPPAQKAPAPKQEIKTPPPQVQRTPAPQPRVVHTAPAQPPAQKAPAPKPEIRTPPPQVQHAPVPQPRVVHTAPAQPTAQKAPPAQQPHQPQGGQKHEPAKGKPTPTP